MKSQKTKRINLVVTEELFDQIAKNADSAYLCVGTYTRLLLIEALENNFNTNLSNDGRRIR